jgi:hypothetical protein
MAQTNHNLCLYSQNIAQYNNYNNKQIIVTQHVVAWYCCSQSKAVTTIASFFIQWRTLLYFLSLVFNLFAKLSADALAVVIFSLLLSWLISNCCCCVAIIASSFDEGFIASAFDEESLLLLEFFSAFFFCDLIVCTVKKQNIYHY